MQTPDEPQSSPEGVLPERVLPQGVLPERSLPEGVLPQGAAPAVRANRGNAEERGPAPDLPAHVRGAVPAGPRSADRRSEHPAVGRPREIGGRDGPEPTRYGDWEKAGRCIDF